MTKKRILIVEDDPIISMSEHQIMENLGYEVTGIALSGEAAVQKVGVYKPDLVLMDIILMGDMDGREAALKIRAFLSLCVRSDFHRAVLQGPFSESLGRRPNAKDIGKLYVDDLAKVFYAAKVRLIQIRAA